MADEEVKEEEFCHEEPDGDECEPVPEAQEAGGDATPEEPAVDAGYAEMAALREHVEVLEKQISGLQASISTIIEAGATVMETASPMAGESEDEEEPFLYLEDLNYDMR